LGTPFPAAAQEDPLDWDFDTLFDGEDVQGDAASGQGDAASGQEDAASDQGEAPPGKEAAAGSGSPLAELLRQSALSLDLSYSANGGFAPGWSEAPWFAAAYDPEYSYVLGVNLNTYLGLDVRISNVLRAHSSIAFSIPDQSYISLKDLFIDYSMFERVFFRVGKFGHNWGISPNFPAANLLSRVPGGSPRSGRADWGEPYILKADVPIGIGGLQLLVLTRPGFMSGTTPGFSELGYGGKYNLAFTWADIDMGLFYHEDMPLRGTVSVKTTVKHTELYVETMGAMPHDGGAGFSVSANLGFVQDFFDDLFTVNGEIFWNGEDSAFYFKPKTELEEAESSPFIPGLNTALNLVFRPRWIGNLRFALTGRWALDTNTAYLLPGLSFSPLPHLDISLGFPIALGGRDGRYYRSNADKNNRPLAIALLINLNGSYHRSF
jgi:hypothetical protein